MHIETKQYADVVVVSPTGRVDHLSAAAFEEQLMPHVHETAGREGVLSMRMDGTDIRVEVKVSAPARPGPGSAPTPDEVVLSPDGSRAIVRANRNVYLITVGFSASCSASNANAVASGGSCSSQRSSGLRQDPSSR